ncbi:MAG: rhomboid family intramembrane serine protease [Pseudomonadota bacterium]
MSDHREDPPVNPLPPVVWLLFFAVVAPELVFFAGEQGLVGGPAAVGWRLTAIEAFGFSAELFDWMVETGRWMPEHLVRFVTYPFVQGSFSGTLFAAVFVLALGKLVGETLGHSAVLLLFVGGGAFGALAYAVLLNDPSWLVGGFPACYGLIGGYTFVVWLSLGARGQEQLGAFSLIAVLMGIQLLFGALFGGNLTWMADLFGFIFGFFASMMTVPGSFARFLQKLRRD